MGAVQRTMIKVMTYNIGGGRRNFGSDMGHVKDTIKSVMPDILGLQEITLLEDMDGVIQDWTAAVAKFLNYEASYFGPTLSMNQHFHVGKSIFIYAVFNDYRSWVQGNGLVSRWGFSRLGNPELPGSPRNIPLFRPPVYEGNRDTDPRNVILSRVQIGDLAPYVLVTHLTTLVGERGNQEIPGMFLMAQAVREKQTKALVNLIREYIIEKQELAILLGDFNAQAFEPGIARVLVEETGFTRLEPVMEVPTHPKAPNPIDHIFIYPGRYHVDYDCWIIDDQIANKASDHKPVAANLYICEPDRDQLGTDGPGVYRRLNPDG